ncbi:MAG: right-handed parallel beta-helix repeat-containing protein, partial [Pirellulales bacterium]
PAETIEQGLDRVVNLVKQAYQLARQSPKMELAHNPATGDITLPLPVAGKILVGNADGTGWDTAELGDLGTTVLPISINNPQEGDVLRYIAGAWKNSAAVEVYASDFGFSVGATGTANKTALDAAIASISSGFNRGKVVLPVGVFLLDALAPFGADDSVEIVGQGPTRTILYTTNTTGNSITIDGTGPFCGIRDLSIYSSVVKTDGFAIALSGGLIWPFVRNVHIQGHWNGISVKQAAEVDLEDITCRYLRGTHGIFAAGTTVQEGIFRITLRDYRTDNPGPNGTDGAIITYAPSTAVALNDMAVIGDKVWVVTTAGTTGASSAPTTPPGTTGDGFVGVPVVDGTAEWQFLYHASLIWLYIGSYCYSVANFGGALLNAAYGVYVDDVVDAGATTPTTPSFPIWHWFDDLECDHQFYYGVTLVKGDGATLQRSWLGSTRNGNCLRIGPDYNGEVKVINTRIAGAGGHGVIWEAGPVDVKFIGCNIGYNSTLSYGTYSGIYVGVNVDGGLIQGCTIGLISYSAWSTVVDPMAWGIAIDTGAKNLIIKDNDLRGNDLGGIFNGSSETTNIIRDNLGYVTRNKGNATIASGSTTAVVAHGLDFTPTAADFVINFREQGTNDYGRFWIDTFTATEFTLNVTSDPGASNLDFSWSVER